jgi:hypothetical protein
MRRYVAAAALQRLARTRITMQLGPQPELPAYFLEDLGVPPLAEEYGRVALFKLSQQEEALYAVKYRRSIVRSWETLATESSDRPVELARSRTLPGA